MAIVPPQEWRIVSDRMKDDEAYIPIAPGLRSGDVLRRMIDGPTEEERAARAQELAAQRQAEAVGRHQRKIRHLALVSMHDGIVRKLLEEHAPHENEYSSGYVGEECHGCPVSHDTSYGESYQSWPCPTWKTISDSTP